MPEIRGRTLALAIQAVDAEIHRLRGLPEDASVPEDDERLVAFENAADDLAELYEQALQAETGLVPYDRLVRADD